jgi:hypothetical protein
MGDDGTPGRRRAAGLLIAELRALRKLRQTLSASSLHRAQVLVRGLGDGDADVALERLISLADEYGEDRDIAAAMVSIGWDSSGENVLERLSEFGSLHNVDQRTVRRWSDAGIEKLATLLVGAAPWLQPRAILVLSSVGSVVQLQLELRVPPNIAMGAPRLLLNGQDIQMDLPMIERSARGGRYRSQLADAAALEDLPVELDLQWRGEKPGSYTAVLEGGEGIRLQATVRLGHLRCQLSLRDGRSVFDRVP